jgi:hypothetical protein
VTPTRSRSSTAVSAAQLGIKTIVPPNPDYLAVAGRDANVVVVVGSDRAGP